MACKIRLPAILSPTELETTRPYGADTEGRLMDDDLTGGFGHTDQRYRTCSQCNGDYEPEPVPTSPCMKIAFSCPAHGVHSLIDPFEGCHSPRPFRGGKERHSDDRKGRRSRSSTSVRSGHSSRS